MNIYSMVHMSQINLPRLTIAQRVIDKIVKNALIYDTETGESLVGFAIKGRGRVEPDMYIVETIPPDETAVRRGAYFEQGDDRQGDIFNWYADNWKLAREKRRGLYGQALGAKWDLPLGNLGDWHKHPGTLIEPSSGDLNTARDYIEDTSATGIQHLLVILATVWDKAYADSYDPPAELTAELFIPSPIKVEVNPTTLVRIDCWYISRATQRFIRLAPSVVPNDALPIMPELPWIILHPERSSTELQALRQAGYTLIALTSHEVGAHPPLEICAAFAHRTSRTVLIMVTDAHYPQSRPSVRTAPLSTVNSVPESASAVDIFHALWQASQPIAERDYPDWAWNADRTMAELGRAIDAKLAGNGGVPAANIEPNIEPKGIP